MGYESIVKGNDIFRATSEINKNILSHKDEIEKLDQEIGDGDHIFNIIRGLEEILKLESSLANENISVLLKQIGIKIMTTVGGSSGALFATLLLNMSKNYDADKSDIVNLSNMFSKGVESMKARGKATVGEKTMLDVLIPVSEKFIELVNSNVQTKDIVVKLSTLAHKKMMNTKDMIATKGRASYLGKRAKGHIDPGARSSQIMIKSICDYVINKRENNL